MAGPLIIKWAEEEGDGDEFKTTIGDVPKKNVITGEATVVVHPSGEFEVTPDPEFTEEPTAELLES